MELFYPIPSNVAAIAPAVETYFLSEDGPETYFRGWSDKNSVSNQDTTSNL